MNFSFTDEQKMIRDSADVFLAEVSSSAAVRQTMTNEKGYDEKLWRRLCDEMCWPAMHIPVEYGGLGLGYVELVATLEQMGRYLLCSPFFSSVCMAANALLIAGNETQKKEWLAKIIAGETASLAFSDKRGSWDTDSVSVTFIPATEQDGYLLNGEHYYVIDGHTVDFLIVAARVPCTREGTFISLFLLDANTEGVTREFLPTMDQTRKQAVVRFNNVFVSKAHVLGELGQSANDLIKILDLARIALAADQVGGAQQVLDSTVDYLKEREQFGRSIASFQAVKHKCADMMLKVEAARSGLYYAACIADEALANTALGEELAEASSIAKGYASDAYFFNAGCGIQLHGGVGFTAEYDIQLYFKRAQSTGSFLGNGDYHRQRLAKMLLDSPQAKAQEQFR